MAKSRPNRGQRNAAVKGPTSLVTEEELKSNSADNSEEEEESDAIDGEDEEESNMIAPDDIQDEEEEETPKPQVDRPVQTDNSMSGVPENELPPERPVPPPEHPFVDHKQIQRDFGEHVVHARGRTYSYGGAHYGPGLVDCVNADGSPIMGVDESGNPDTVANIIRRKSNIVEKPVNPTPQRVLVRRPMDPSQQVTEDLFAGATIPRED